MSQPIPQEAASAMAIRVAELESRVRRLEARLDEASNAWSEPSETDAALSTPLGRAWRRGGDPEAEELEFVVGQSWFSKAGVVILTLGLGCLLALPYPGSPTAAPSVAGLVLAGAMLWMANRASWTLAPLAPVVRAAGLGLGYFAVLRLYYFGAESMLAASTLGGRTVMVAVVAAGVTLAWRQRAPGLTVLALVAAFGAALLGGGTWFALAMMTAVTLTTAVVSRARMWRWLPLVGAALAHGTYLLWALGNPFRSGGIHLVSNVPAAPLFLLLNISALALVALAQLQDRDEEGVSNSAALVNCGCGYSVFLLHTFAAYPGMLAPAHAAAFVLFLGLAGLFWVRVHSRVSTFFYAMTGYAALTAAILKLTPVPDVFVWLSLESVVVVATAIWFRSRFIVVTNFGIYVAIVLAYVMLAKSESGISLGFGVVALISARILRWQQRRLELKTELMRNAYLASAFIIFPYAMYHLVPNRYIALAWVGLAVTYYVLNLIVRSPKYRWMGHATLLLTTVYLTFIGFSRSEPMYRIVSFLVLGSVLLGVSLAFTRARRRKAE
jgi:uncharacterized membrane protein